MKFKEKFSRCFRGEFVSGFQRRSSSKMWIDDDRTDDHGRQVITIAHPEPLPPVS